MLHSRDLTGVPIAWADSPFGSLGGKVYREVRPSGLSIAELVRSVPNLPDSFDSHGTVCINGEEVPRWLWPHVKPKPASELVPVAVTLHLPLGAGGGSSARSGQKNSFQLVASIAILAATVFIGGGGLAGLGGAFAKGALGAKLLAAGVGLIGSLLIAGLSPPPALQETTGNTDQSKGSASADGNTIDIGGQIPRVCGTFRVYPSLACEPLIEIDGEDEVATGIYCLAGPHALSEIRLDNASVDDADDVTTETREGWINDPPITLLTRQARTTLPQIQVSRPRLTLGTTLNINGYFQLLEDQANPADCMPIWHQVASRANPDEIRIHIYFPGGLQDVGTPTTAVGMPIRMRMRTVGSTLWHDLPEIHFSDYRASTIRKEIRLIWGTEPSPTPTPPTSNGAIYAFNFAPGQNSGFGGSGNNLFLAANPPFFKDATTFNNALLSASTVSTTNVRNVALYSDRAEIYLNNDLYFPRGSAYEIEFKFGSSYTVSQFTQASYQYVGLGYDFFSYFDAGLASGGAADNRIGVPAISQNFSDKAALVRVVNVWNEHPIGVRGLALLAVQVRNRALSQVSVLASGYVQDWNETDEQWTSWTTTSNPAPHYNDVLRGGLTTKAVPAVDDDRLSDWRQNCIDNGYTFDGIMDGRNMGEALTLLAASGYARPRKSETWSVIIDKDRTDETPVQIFGPRNLGNFHFEKAFADLPHALNVTFRDSELDYQTNQEPLVVYRAGYGPGTATRIEQVDYIGPVTREAAEARARYDLLQAELRSTFYYADADAEAIVAEAGDLVAVQHDILDHQAGFARVKEVRLSGGNVTGLLLDSKVPLAQPDDISSVDMMLLNNVEGCILGNDVAQMADFSAVTDITSDASSMIGVAIRYRDGSINIKQVTAATDEDDEVSFVTPFSDPGTALDVGCLVHSGAINREYRRLILREASPGKDLTAQLVFIDEANDLFAQAA